MSSEIWVFSEQPALLAELISAGSEFGEVTALVSGARSLAEQTASQGAHKIYWLGEISSKDMVEDLVPTITRLAKEEQPSLILIGSTRRGRAVAGRLAACLGIDALTDAIELQKQDGNYQIRHMIFGGGAIRTDRTRSNPALVTIGTGLYQPHEKSTDPGAEIREISPVVLPRVIKIRERKPLPKASVNLQAARKVVSAGRGVSRQADLAMVEQLAGLLGAEVGCTRPLAEGLDWLPRERYIGISGAHIKPDLYFGVGVSGQVQHMIGMNGSRVVVAVNKDANAPIFTQADYGIVTDLYTFIPALIKALQSRN